MNKLIAAIGSVALLILLIIVLIQALGLSSALYGALQKPLGVADYVGVSQDDLDDVTNVFNDYTKGYRDDLDVVITYKGEKTQMFNAREVAHMIDVKNLYHAGQTLVWWLSGIAVLAFGYLIIAKKSKVIFKTHTRVSLGFLIFCIALGIYFALDFNGFWTNVHLLLFTNDLWLLNPATDRMIRMFPLDFFLSLSVIILTVFAVVFAVLWGVAKRISKLAEA